MVISYIFLTLQQNQISFIPFLAFDQVIIEQGGKGLKLRNLTQTDSDYVTTFFNNKI